MGGYANLRGTGNAGSVRGPLIVLRKMVWRTRAVMLSPCLGLPCLSFPIQNGSGDPGFGVTEFGARSGDLLVVDELLASGCSFS